jgi:hypothetical protein
MRRIAFPILTLALLGGLFTFLTSSASAGTTPPCDGGESLLRGVIRDASNDAAIAGAEINVVDDAENPVDQVVTNGNGRYQACYPNGTYHLKFTAEYHRLQWYAKSANFESSSDVVLSGETVVANAELTPKGRVLAGRVTNNGGVPKFASVTIWRLTPSGWRSYDNIGNDLPSGRWWFRVPAVGRYRVNACVDSHWCRWATNATRLRFARNLNITTADTYLTDVDIRTPYCHAAPDFCVPAGFLT